MPLPSCPLPHPKYSRRMVAGRTADRHFERVGPRYWAMVVEFDEKVKFLPVRIDYFETTDVSQLGKETFNGVDSTWKKKSEAKIQWQDLRSGLYGPKSLSIHTYNIDDHTMSIYFTDWKIGDAVDSSLLDEADR